MGIVRLLGLAALFAALLNEQNSDLPSDPFKEADMAAAASTVASAVSSSAVASAAATAMPYVVIPGVGKCSRLVLGTWQFGDPTATYTKQSAETEAAIVKAAFDAGINVIDTAEAYGAGESEKAVAAALKAAGIKREDVVLATKVLPQNLEPSKLRAALEASLSNLETTYVDLYQIHWPLRGEWDVKATFEELRKLQEEGKVRAIGVSNFGKEDLAAALATGVKLVTNQLPFSLVWRAIEYDIVKPCRDNSVGILAYSPLGQGLLTGKYEKTSDCGPGLARSRLFAPASSPKSRHTEPGCEAELWSLVAELKAASEKVGRPMACLALQWVLAQEGVSAVVFGASRPDHVSRNVEAALTPLEPDVAAALTAASEPVKAKIGANPDMWDDKDGGRYR